jgi:sterol desaturase/sphingolipid hydroxylase (fatty acid hydroxylase superfamily)
MAIVLGDITIYWVHRLQHRWNFLWRFHKVHHTAEHLDWLASWREHPIDTFITILAINFPAIALGISLNAITGFIVFRGIWAIYIHSNVRLNIGPLKYILGSPELHHWHHDKDRDRGNYGNVSPIMDLIFGTHYQATEYPKTMGIHEEFPKNYVGQIVTPLLPDPKKEPTEADSSYFSLKQELNTD